MWSSLSLQLSQVLTGKSYSSHILRRIGPIISACSLVVIVRQKWLGKIKRQPISASTLNDGLCAEGAVYRQDGGLVLRNSTDVSLTEVRGNPLPPTQDEELKSDPYGRIWAE